MKHQLQPTKNGDKIWCKRCHRIWDIFDANSICKETCVRLKHIQHDKKDKSGYVYVFADSHGNFKIGMSVNWKRRFAEPAFGPETKVEAVFKALDRRKLERQLHGRFDPLRVKGSGSN